MDNLSKAHRSWNMGRIRSKNTKPELLVRSMLHRMGYRFRLHKKGLPGKPDIVLAKYKTVIFVHGCFWHRHPGCKNAYHPKSRVEFWERKFRENVARDKRIRLDLESLDWRVVTLWECEVASADQLRNNIRELL